MDSPPAGRRIRLLIAYDGTNYSGWQRQKKPSTIQGELEACLSRMTREEISVHGAGRTDGGVHADGMVAHFDTYSKIPAADFSRGLNSMLPGAIRILDCSTCDNSFHSRFSALGKKYQYTLFTGPVQPPQMRLYTVHVKSPLNIGTMQECLEAVYGCHDFSSFENSGSRDKSSSGGRGAHRTIYKTELFTREDDQLVFEFIGDGFLRNMVRNLVGTIVDAGKGKITTEEFAVILEQKNRSMAGATAPPHGLFLKEVYYEKVLFCDAGNGKQQHQAG